MSLLIETTSLFSAPETQPSGPAAASPPPATNPFQSPEFGEDDAFAPEEGHGPATSSRLG
ncbi:hypothetical protein GCM10010293_57930 [Streptomyces griseoflavus]|nr:hypothetical protein GCM10010293_57930 [Streptomyces griseoflavus]